MYSKLNFIKLHILIVACSSSVQQRIKCTQIFINNSCLKTTEGGVFVMITLCFLNREQQRIKDRLYNFILIFFLKNQPVSSRCHFEEWNIISGNCVIKRGRQKEKWSFEYERAKMFLMTVNVCRDVSHFIHQVTKFNKVDCNTPGPFDVVVLAMRYLSLEISYLPSALSYLIYTDPIPSQALRPSVHYSRQSANRWCAISPSSKLLLRSF